MRKIIATIKKFAITLGAGVLLLVPQFAHAQAALAAAGAAIGLSYVTDFSASAINFVLSWIATSILGLCGILVTVGGFFLNLSMKLTLHISDIYNAVPSIGSVWTIVRDLSSIFIIFALLFYAISIIVGAGDQWSKLIKNIFIAGMLINFSLFFCRVAIDASNVISLQFYNAITPSASAENTSGLIAAGGNSLLAGVGIADVFMSSLKLQSIYKTDVLKKGDITGAILVSAIGGSMMMIAAAFSFFAAAIAFVIRLAILLFCMAISPLYFAGFIWPQVKKQVSDKLLSYFTGQLIFMPLYLFLMYIALRFITDDRFTSLFNASTNLPTGSSITLGLILQFIIAIVFINVPLIAAASYGAESVKWAKVVSGRASGVIGRHTLGKLTKRLGENFDKGEAAMIARGGITKGIATTLRATKISTGARAALQKGEDSKYGGVYTIASLKKEDTQHERKMEGITRIKEQGIDLATMIKTGKTPKAADGTQKDATVDEYKKLLSKMNGKEIEELKDDDVLFNTRVAAALSTKQAEGVLKSEGLNEKEKHDFKQARTKGFIDNMRNVSAGDMDNVLKEDLEEEQKDALKAARKKTLTDLAAGTSPEDKEALKKYMGKLTGKDIAKWYNGMGTVPENVIENLKPNMLKDFDEMDDTTRRYIGQQIYLWTGSHELPHPAYDLVNKNKAYWLKNTNG